MSYFGRGVHVPCLPCFIVLSLLSHLQTGFRAYYPSPVQILQFLSYSTFTAHLLWLVMLIICRVGMTLLDSFLDCVNLNLPFLLLPTSPTLLFLYWWLFTPSIPWHSELVILSCIVVHATISVITIFIHVNPVQCFLSQCLHQAPNDWPSLLGYFWYLLFGHYRWLYPLDFVFTLMASLFTKLVSQLQSLLILPVSHCIISSCFDYQINHLLTYRSSMQQIFMISFFKWVIQWQIECFWTHGTLVGRRQTIN